MPDLKFWNYDSQSFNEPVVTQVKDALKKWLLLGADGFRIDAAKHFIEGEESNAAAAEPRNLELLADLMTSAKQVSPAAEFLGEIWSGHDVIDQYLPSTLSRSLDFPFMESLRESITKEDPSSLKAVLAHFKATQENISPSARVVFFGNHDTSRLASLWGDDLRKQKLATFITFVLPQTPLLLYGEEIGMEGKVKRPDPNDPTDKIEYVHTDRAMPWNALGKFGPDQSRSPGPSVTLPENIETRNLESSLADPESLLNFLKNLMELRMKGSIGAGSKIEALNAIGTVLRVDLAFDDGRYAKAFFNVSSSNSQSLSAEFLGQNSSSQKALSEGLQVLDPQQGDTAGVIAPLGYVLYLTP
jgi:glycosidase